MVAGVVATLSGSLWQCGIGDLLRRVELKGSGLGLDGLRLPSFWSSPSPTPAAPAPFHS